MEFGRRIDNPYPTPLIRQLGIDGQAVLEGLEPTYLFWVGDRDLEKRGGWNIFFDRVPTRPYTVEKGLLLPENVSVSRQAGRTTIEISGLKSASFSGALAFVFYKGCPFVHMEARVATQRPATAFLSEAGDRSGLVSELSCYQSFNPWPKARLSPTARAAASTSPSAPTLNSSKHRYCCVSIVSFLPLV